jgi:hypothetical protein
MAHRNRNILVGLALSAAVGFTAAYLPGDAAQAQGKPAAGPKAGTGGAPAAPEQTCAKKYGKNCCDPKVMEHLPKDAVFKACGESDATFLGESGQKDTCKYHFKVEGEKADEMYVQVYTPAQKDAPPMPADPFFSYKKVGKAYVTDKAKSPKSAPIAAAQTGLYLATKEYVVSVSASTKVCTKPEATKLTSSMK